VDATVNLGALLRASVVRFARGALKDHGLDESHDTSETAF
jgi:hypothetical protein